MTFTIFRRKITLTLEVEIVPKKKKHIFKKTKRFLTRELALNVYYETLNSRSSMLEIDEKYDISYATAYNIANKKHRYTKDIR